MIDDVPQYRCLKCEHEFEGDRDPATNRVVGQHCCPLCKSLYFVWLNYHNMFTMLVKGEKNAYSKKGSQGEN